MDTLEKIMDMAGTVSPFTIMIVFSIVALLLLMLLLRREGIDPPGHKRRQSKLTGVADLLNWAAVIDDGIIINKNGSLMAAWFYRGGDNTSATNTDRNAVSHYLNAAMKQLGSG